MKTVLRKTGIVLLEIINEDDSSEFQSQREFPFGCFWLIVFAFSQVSLAMSGRMYNCLVFGEASSVRQRVTDGYEITD